jgi:hypothetical protein
MNKPLLTIAVTTAIALAGAAPATQAQEVECDGVLVQSRLALTNCMVESAVAVAAALVSQEGCVAETWNIGALVDEYYLQTMPIQGSLTVAGGDDDFFLLNGKVAAVFNPAKNNVLCQVSSEDVENTLYGVPFTYSGGKDNLYPDAVIDRDESLVCVNDFSSAGNITIEEPPRPRLEEVDELTFDETLGVITAGGYLTILERKGNNPSSEEWSLVEMIVLPPENSGNTDGFSLTASRSINGCTITVNGDIFNGADASPFWLTMDGTMSVSP